MTMRVIDGKEVSEAVFRASEDEFQATGHTSYIRPIYRNDTWVGWAVYVGGEAVGRVFEEHKQATLLLMQIRAEQEFQE
jgi:hypothetical protein